MIQRKHAWAANTSDPMEREADHAADLVSSGPAPLPGASSGGPSLDPATRGFMESRLGHSFGSVRIHADAAAGDRAQGLSAKAFTVGQDLYFGHGEYAPGTESGRALIAHELAHVVQQRTGAASGIQKAPHDCATKTLADVETDVKAKVDAAVLDPEAGLTGLYLALKRARACFSDFDEAAFLALVPESTKIYSDDLRKSAGKGHAKKVRKDDRKLAWAESLKPFAGYHLSGFDTANRLLTGENKRKLGGTMAPSHKPFREFADKQNEADNRDAVQQAFSEANVLVFSGHQYAQYKLPGVWNTGNWDVTLDTRGLTGPLDNVKLLISTSCATLCKEAYELWKTLFPKAFFLGAARSTPLKGSTLANAFVKKLPKDLLFDQGATGVSGAVSAWKSAVQKTQTSAVRGGVLDIAAGTVELWNGKRWLNMSATDEDNKCKVKDDWASLVPDPRSP
ncbi:MAG TPA: DUF4157 domain-containing protein [Thermoanaerobaculia bacterium]|nr:DUF4157 domain-containing protein [Thermoanaerobaculia bacterium]